MCTILQHNCYTTKCTQHTHKLKVFNSLLVKSILSFSGERKLLSNFKVNANVVKILKFYLWSVLKFALKLKICLSCHNVFLEHFNRYLITQLFFGTQEFEFLILLMNFNLQISANFTQYIIDKINCFKNFILQQNFLYRPLFFTLKEIVK